MRPAFVVLFLALLSASGCASFERGFKTSFTTRYEHACAANTATSKFPDVRLHGVAFCRCASNYTARNLTIWQLLTFGFHFASPGVKQETIEVLRLCARRELHVRTSGSV